MRRNRLIPHISFALCLAGPLALAACETRGGGFVSRATGTGGGFESATLTGLSVSGTTLDPAFDAAVTSYAATVSNAIDVVSVTPSAPAGATVTLNGAVVQNGGPTGVALAEGQNTVTINVSNDAGQASSYTVLITRAAGTP